MLCLALWLPWLCCCGGHVRSAFWVESAFAQDAECRRRRCCIFARFALLSTAPVFFFWRGWGCSRSRRRLPLLFHVQQALCVETVDQSRFPLRPFSFLLAARGRFSLSEDRTRWGLAAFVVVVFVVCVVWRAPSFPLPLSLALWVACCVRCCRCFRGCVLLSSCSASRGGLRACQRPLLLPPRRRCGVAIEPKEFRVCGLLCL